MGKNKLKKFAENRMFEHVFEPSFNEILKTDHAFKGKWAKKVFKNNNPITLELGCGKGEYVVNLASKNPDKNYIGIDIKGARIWKGAKDVADKKLKNVIFIRTKIEFITKFFSDNEINEIWITFPDPQPKKRQIKNRLTHTKFLKMYQTILTADNCIHLKTDSMLLHNYTKNLLTANNQQITDITDNLYESNLYNDDLKIKTHYETLFLEGNPTITYLKFKLNKTQDLIEPEIEDD